MGISKDIRESLIHQVTHRLKFLDDTVKNRLIPKLITLADNDNDLIIGIKRILDQKKSPPAEKGFWDSDTNIALVAVGIAVGIALFIYGYAFFVSAKNVKDDNTKNRTELVKFDSEMPASQNVQTAQKKNLPKEDKAKKVFDLSTLKKWKGNQLKTGASPYNSLFGKGLYNRNYHNRIKFKNGHKTDVIVCLTNYSSNKTIRNEYIRAGDSFEMTEIPNGTYYIKSFFGNDWNPERINSGVKGCFESETGFSKSDSWDDLIKLEENHDGYSIYEITLYPVLNGNMESESIDSDQFFQ